MQLLVGEILPSNFLINCKKKNNKLVRLVLNKTKRKAKLLCLYVANNFLKIRSIYKMKIAKFMVKLRIKEISTIFYSNF